MQAREGRSRSVPILPLEPKVRDKAVNRKPLSVPANAASRQLQELHQRAALRETETTRSRKSVRQNVSPEFAQELARLAVSPRDTLSPSSTADESDSSLSADPVPDPSNVEFGKGFGRTHPKQPLDENSIQALCGQLEVYFDASAAHREAAQELNQLYHGHLNDCVQTGDISRTSEFLRMMNKIALHEAELYETVVKEEDSLRALKARILQKSNAMRNERKPSRSMPNVRQPAREPHSFPTSAAQPERTQSGPASKVASKPVPSRPAYRPADKPTQDEVNASDLVAAKLVFSRPQTDPPVSSGVTRPRSFQPPSVPTRNSKPETKPRRHDSNTSHGTLTDRGKVYDHKSSATQRTSPSDFGFNYQSSGPSTSPSSIVSSSRYFIDPSPLQSPDSASPPSHYFFDTPSTMGASPSVHDDSQTSQEEANESTETQASRPSRQTRHKQMLSRIPEHPEPPEPRQKTQLARPLYLEF